MAMKNIFYSLMVVVTLPSLMSCGNGSDDPLPPAHETTPRTVLVYMVAQNNLSGNGESDLAEMLQAARDGHLGESRLLVYHDGLGSSPKLYEITPQGREIICEYDDETMSVARERFEQVILDAKEAAPADRYGLIMWGHGTGYVQDGIEEPAINTLSYGGESVDKKSYWMNTTTMARALEDKGFDWIYFDCCFMAGVEVAYELRGVTDYIVASATELPAEGMPYQKTLRYLMPGNSDLIGAAGETFGHFDAMRGMYRTCTMSVIRTAALDELARVMRSVYITTSVLPEGYVPQCYQTDDDHARYGWAYYDLEHYAMALAGNHAVLSKAVPIAVGMAVSAAYATPKLWNEVDLSNHCGLSTLIIESDDDPQLDRFGYRELQWWSDVVQPRFIQD